MDLFDLLPILDLLWFLLCNASLAELSCLTVSLNLLQFFEQLNERTVLALIQLSQHQRRVPGQFGLQQPLSTSRSVTRLLKSLEFG